jgi:succinate dehydrogenase/fumarate reductase flavoprotein subunit
MYKQFQELDGIDISKDKMEVGPTAHYSMGGVVVDINCRTKVKGLFAVGETISQIHGANRLGGNSLLDTAVFGKIAGREAAEFADKVKEEREETGQESSSSSQTRSNTANDNKSNNNNNQRKKFDTNGNIFTLKEPMKFRNEIHELMKQNAGIIREQAKLENGLKRILELKSEFYSKDNSIIMNEFKVDDVNSPDNNNVENVVLTWQVKSSLIACEAIIRSALMRQESRGAHFRSDFPKLDDKIWKVNIYCRNKVAGEDKERERLDTEMILFKYDVKGIKGPLADFLKAHTKAEHQREFE